MGKVALYARVSTDDKDQNPETQLFALRRYCQERGLEVFREYVDKKRAKDYRGRKEWAQLLKDMRRRLFHCIIVYKIDRMSREARYTLNILKDFEDRSVRFISITQDVDTSTATGRTFTQMLAVMAESESGITGERVKSGIARHIAEGKPWGPKPLNIPLEVINGAIKKTGSVAAAARELKCSRAYIYKILSQNTGKNPRVKKGGK